MIDRRAEKIFYSPRTKFKSGRIYYAPVPGILLIITPSQAATADAERSGDLAILAMFDIFLTYSYVTIIAKIAKSPELLRRDGEN